MSMPTLEEAIGIFEQLSKLCETNGIHDSQELYKQYAEWLRELKERRAVPEIVRCGECVNFAERDFCKVAGHNVHRKSNCMQVFGAERRTDGSV